MRERESGKSVRESLSVKVFRMTQGAFLGYFNPMPRLKNVHIIASLFLLLDVYGERQFASTNKLA